MPYSRSLVDFLPDRLRRRLAEDEDAAVGHVIASIQPSLDLIIDAIENEPDLYDPDICPPQFLDWLGQLVGLARSGNDYLGLGMNPVWSDARKRLAIGRAWQYWQIKGTRLGVDEALKIWLNWEPSSTTRLESIAPFGSIPTHTPPLWAGWNIDYYQQLLLPVRQVRRLGGGGTPLVEKYLTNYHYLPESILGQIFNPTVRLGTRQLQQASGAAHQSNCHWQHFFLSASDWLKIAPDIADLNSEIQNASIEAFPCTWLNLTDSSPLALTSEVGIEDFTNGSNWRLTIVTNIDAYVVPPSIGYLIDGATAKILRTQASETYYLEWLFSPLKSGRIQRIYLTYQNTLLLDYVPVLPLPIDSRIQLGFTARCTAMTREYIPIEDVDIDIDPSNTVQIVSVTTSGLAAIDEGSPGKASGFATFTFKREVSSSVNRALTVYFTLAGTATYGMDYNIEATSSCGFDGTIGFVRFARNQLETNVRFMAVPDVTVEPDETVILSIVANPTIVIDALKAVATWTILDDDALYLAINGGTFVRDSNFNLIEIIE